MTESLATRCRQHRDELEKVHLLAHDLLGVAAQHRFMTDDQAVSTIFFALLAALRDGLGAIGELTWTERSAAVWGVFRAFFETVVDTLYCASDSRKRRLERCAALTAYSLVAPQAIATTQAKMHAAVCARAALPAADKRRRFTNAAQKKYDELVQQVGRPPSPDNRSSWTFLAHCVDTLHRLSQGYQSDWSNKSIAKRVDCVEGMEDKDSRLLEAGVRVLYASACAFSHGSSGALNYVKGAWVDNKTGRIAGLALLTGRLGDWHYSPYLFAPRFLGIVLARLDSLTGQNYSGSVRKLESERLSVMESIYGNDRELWQLWE